MRVKLFFACLLFSVTAHAVTIEKPLSDPAQEHEAQQAIRQLKCVVCEGQALADSDATFAREMREEVRRRAAQGDSSTAILDYFAGRYGQQILLTPPMRGTTLPLWLAPFVLLLLGALLLKQMVRRRP